MKAVMTWLERNMGLVLLVGTAVALAGVTFAGLRGLPLDDAHASRHELEAGRYHAILSLNKGSDKPLLLSDEGRTLLDVSGWESRIRVNGSERALYRHEYGVAREGGTAYLTWSAPEYALEQRVLVSEEGVRLEWWFVRAPRTGPQEVVVEIGQYAYLMRDASLVERTVRFALDPWDPREAPPKPVRPEPYAVTLAFDRAPDALWFGETERGVDSVHVAVRLADAPEGEPTLLFAQTVTYERGGLPPADGALPTRAIPVDDKDPHSLRLRAGSYQALVATGKGSERPVLRTLQGRDLFEVTAWESHVTVNGTKTILYRHDANVSVERENATLTWALADHRVEESVRLTSEGLEVAWRYVREPGEGPQDVQLSVAAFARYMGNASAQGREVRYHVQDADGRPLTVRVLFDRDVDGLRFAQAPGGTDAFHALVRFAAAPQGQGLDVLAMRVWAEEGTLPPLEGRPALREGVPLRIEEPPRIELRAGDLLATVALNKGSDKPLLRHAPTGRALMEVSAWESFLRVDGEERILYRHEALLNVTDDEVCLRWVDPAFTLRQCIALSSDDLTVRWSWLRAPGAPAQDVRLQVGHFAAFLLQESHEPGKGVHYVLSPRAPGEAPWETGEAGHIVHLAFSPEPERVDFGRAVGGTDAVRATWALDAPPEGVETLFFTETVRVAPKVKE